MVQPQAPQAPTNGPAQQPNPTQVPQSSPSGNKGIAIAVGIVLLVVGAVIGYGFWNGSQHKAYAAKAEDYMKTVDSWDVDASDVASFSEEIAKIKSESEKILEELNSKKAPAKAGDLEKDLKEYFSLAVEMTNEMEKYSVLLDALAEMEKAFTSISFDSETPEEIAQSMRDVSDTLKEMSNKLSSIDIPGGTEKDIKKLTSLFEDMVDIMERGARATERGDHEALMDMQDELFSLDYDFSDFGSFDAVYSIGNIYQERTDRLDKLETDIKEQAKNISGMSFVLF